MTDNRELDHQVAMALGWTKLDDRRWMQANNLPWLWSEPPPYSTDDGVALEALREYCGETNFLIGKHGKDYICTIFSSLKWTTGTTVADAICRCIIAAHEAGKEKNK